MDELVVIDEVQNFTHSVKLQPGFFLLHANFARFLTPKSPKGDFAAPIKVCDIIVLSPL
jgi:hypothetical protein